MEPHNPRRFREFIGQKSVVQRLEILLNAWRMYKEPLPHILFEGPFGIGKKTLASVLPNELGTSIQMANSASLNCPRDLLPFLTNAEEASILFIDEIHRMPRVVEELIYSATEDFRADIVLGEGINARSINLKLKRFTLIGATTCSGLLSGRMRDRFKMHEHLEFYNEDDLAQIVTINAKKLQTKIDQDAARELASRSRGNPRIANARLWWARNFAASEADGCITLDIAKCALEMAEVDISGLDQQDRRYLETLVGICSGGPTGVEALAATMNLSADILSDEIEPYLLREQFIVRSPRGRVATGKAYEHLGRQKPGGPPGSLFE
jgi:Holliday junction DNA helicase RuvB